MSPVANGFGLGRIPGWHFFPRIPSVRFSHASGRAGGVRENAGQPAPGKAAGYARL